MVPNLVIEIDRIAIPMESLDMLREELKDAGLTSGNLSVGELNAAPEMTYFLWFEPGEVPVSMLLRRDLLLTKEGIHEAAHAFLEKWEQRMHIIREHQRRTNRREKKADVKVAKVQKNPLKTSRGFPSSESPFGKLLRFAESAPSPPQPSCLSTCPQVPPLP
jgi:hypothetical protein